MNEMTSGKAGIPFLAPSETVTVTRDVVFGEGGVVFVAGQGAARHRSLKLDVYAPDDPSAHPRPALVLAFGGAFHRGSKETDEFGDADGMSTPMAEYCRLFAERGYVCFCIDYRLTQEMPHPGFTPVLQPGEPMNKDRVNVVRGMMGLPPATDEELANGIEAATDDMVKAVTFVRSRSRHYNVDLSRIAVGGFSAGGIIALAAAFSERVPVAAAVAFSGRFSARMLETCVSGAKGEPAVLMFIGENDLPSIRDGWEATEAHLQRVGLPHRIAHVPGGTHFYPRTARVAEAHESSPDVERVMSDFLYKALDLAAI